jgi:hypothetical protein
MAQNHEFGRRAYRPQEPRELPPDPTVDEGTVKAPWKWALTGAIAAVMLLTMYGVTTHRDEQLAANPPPTTGSVPVPGGAVNRPGG